jgi:nucleotide-binding universal stress UspA family protein
MGASITKVLVPIDFSALSNRAIELAAELASRYGASLTVLHVFEPMVFVVPDGAVLQSPEGLADQLRDTEQLVAKGLAAAQAAGAKDVRSLVRQGGPVEEKLAEAKDNGYDLVVMGTHGRSGLKHALLGSVAEQLIRRASCPVLTVRLSGAT